MRTEKKRSRRVLYFEDCGVRDSQVSHCVPEGE